MIPTRPDRPTGAEGPVVVLGASGKTGRRVVERLAARGVPVREFAARAWGQAAA